ncbi:MAG: HslU--HslV peptidase ATPase subunit, partial [Pseudomonadota bacterium]|nr:HslU--HslV peptidase ATPase subunit [Pseudomonadota bacterium]
LRVSFSADGIAKIAETAWQVNERTENIGARRLHTVMERLLEEVSYSASDLAVSDDKELIIDRVYVEKQLDELAGDEDLSRYIL